MIAPGLSRLWPGLAAALLLSACATARGTGAVPASTAGGRWTVSQAGALPPPSGGAADAAVADPADPYAAFARFALAASGTPPEPGRRRSALLDQATLAGIAPALAPCGSQPPAVMIDLDKGEAPLDLADPPLAAAGLPAHLAALRQAGITVAWVSALKADAAEDVYTLLQATGLDPDRTDRLLLLTAALDRKQLRRDAAARDWCVLALAGDRRGDFDEVFDYLRDPGGTIGRALESNIGAGWFLAPPPID